MYSLGLVVISFLLFSRTVALNVFGGGASVPKTLQQRDQQAVDAIQKAVRSPQTPSYPLIECEFPALAQLNKLGDGSRQSAQAAEQANLKFCQQMTRTLAPLPFLGPEINVVLPTASTRALHDEARKNFKGCNVYRASESVTQVGAKSICVFLTPNDARDYANARQLAGDHGVTTILVNGLFKDRKSVPCQATMAYYYKPLTYNSQIAGYLLRSFPNDWTVVTATGRVLASYKDEEILVADTNTPDLRGPVKLVQQAADQQARAQRRRH